jgi:hypothetical protein
MNSEIFQLKPETMNHASHRATALVRRTCHALLPILKHHEPHSAGPLSQIKVKMMDEVGSPESPSFPTIQLCVPPNQHISAIINDSLVADQPGQRASHRVVQWIFWDYARQPAPSHQIIQYLDALMNVSTGNSHTALIFDFGDLDQNKKPDIIELLLRHVDPDVPIFGIHGCGISLYSNALTDSYSDSEIVATLAASSLCHRSFCKALGGIREAEAGETEDFIEIYQETLFQ